MTIKRDFHRTIGGTSQCPDQVLPYGRGGFRRGDRILVPSHEGTKKPKSDLFCIKVFAFRFFTCHIVPNHRTFIDDYLKIVEFIEWLKDFYPEKAAFLTKKS